MASTTTSDVLLVSFDFHGAVEYSVPPQGAGTQYITEKTVPFDWFCPQPDGSTYGVVKCWGHQHIGGECLTLMDADTGATICQSCPVYGNSTGVAGDEKGYLVGMAGDLLDQPYTLKPGQRVM